MTGFKIWCLIVLIVMAMEFITGFRSVQRNKRHLYTPAERIFIMHHSKDERCRTQEGREDMMAERIFCRNVILALLITIGSYFFIDGVEQFAKSFTTIKERPHECGAMVVSTMLATFACAVLLFAINRLGRYIRKRMLYHEVDAYDEGVIDGHAAVRFMHSTVKVMYKDPTPRLENVVTSAHEEDRDLASYEIAKEWFRRSGEEVRSHPKVVARRREMDRRVKESEAQLYVALGINPNREPISARDRFYQAFGIHAD